MSSETSSGTEMADQGHGLHAREAPLRFNVLKCQAPMTSEKSVVIEMRDGVRIAADVFRPAGPGPFPTLYAVSPYNKETVRLPPHGVFCWSTTRSSGSRVSPGRPARSA